MSQTAIEVEAKSADDSTKGERGQARLPIVGRAAESRVCYRLDWNWTSWTGTPSKASWRL